jgi:hypothetical protein
VAAAEPDRKKRIREKKDREAGQSRSINGSIEVAKGKYQHEK